MIISTKKSSPLIFMVAPGHQLSLIHSWHPSLICVPTGYTVCRRQEEALLTTLSSSTDAGPVEGQVSKRASPPCFLLCSGHALLWPQLAGCWAHPFCELWWTIRNSVLCFEFKVAMSWDCSQPWTEGMQNYVIMSTYERFSCVQGPDQWVTIRMKQSVLG